MESFAKILMFILHIPIYVLLAIVFIYFTVTNILRTSLELLLDKRAKKNYWDTYFDSQKKVYKQLLIK